MVIDDNGDLEPDWALWYISPYTDEMIKYMEFNIGPNGTMVKARYWAVQPVHVIYAALEMHSFVKHSFWI